jgi:hypothetical protein
MKQRVMSQSQKKINVSNFFAQLPFDFTKLKEVDRKKEAHIENITTLLDDNNLVRKPCSEGGNRLFRALSDAIFLTEKMDQEMQHNCIHHLKHLITINKLPLRLGIFQGNSTIWNDYSVNPSLPGFEKINIELVSITYQCKVILYTVTEEGYLTSTIFNNKFDKVAQIIRTQGVQFDAVFRKDYIQTAGICQNMMLSIIDRSLNDNAKLWRNHNNDKYRNACYNTKPEEPQRDSYKITKSHHKKSLSDNFNVNFETMEEQEMKYYNMFMTKRPTDDLLKLLHQPRPHKDTDENFIVSHLKFLEEPNHETYDSKMAIRNYPMNSSNISSGTPTIQDNYPPSSKHAQLNNRSVSANNIFFNEALSLTDIEKMEQIEIQEKRMQENGNQDNPLSPLYFCGTPPPGLTPTRLVQKSYTAEPLMYTNDHGYLSNSQMMANGIDIKHQYSLMSTPPPNSSAYQIHSAGKRPLMNSKNLTLSTHSDEFQGFPELMIPMELQRQQLAAMALQMQFASGEKKKPIILDESKQRYSGRLKFFDENKNYGFIIMDEDGSDIFVHYDDLQKANISKDVLKTARMGCTIKLAFSCMKYIGKYDKSRKATDIQLLKFEG